MEVGLGGELSGLARLVALGAKLPATGERQDNARLGELRPAHTQAGVTVRLLGVRASAELHNETWRVAV